MIPPSHQLTHQSDRGRAFLRDPTLPAATLDLIATLARDQFETLYAIAAHPNVSPWLASVLSRHPDLRIRERIAVHPSLPKADKRRLLFRDDARVRAAILRTIRLTPMRARYWLIWNSIYIAEALAGHPDTPDDVLRELMSNPNPSVQITIASRHRLNPAIMEQLTDRWFEESTVLAALARRQDCPSELLAEYAADGRMVVKAAVASNPHYPRHLLEKWTTHRDERVRTAARHTLVTTNTSQSEPHP